MTMGIWSDYEYGLEWKGTIVKGQKVRLALVPSDHSEAFEFILPTSELGKPAP